MSKKERVKGKGADIFFSENQVSCCFDNHSESSVETTKKAEDKDELSKADRSSLSSTEELATKATFYFQKSQLDALEKAVFLLKQEYRIKTNKSEVMRIALDEIIKEFEENQKDSALFTRLAG